MSLSFSSDMLMEQVMSLSFSSDMLMEQVMSLSLISHILMEQTTLLLFRRPLDLSSLVGCLSQVTSSVHLFITSPV